MSGLTAANLSPLRASSQLQDLHGAAPKLSTESQALLSAIAKLLAQHGEQIEAALQADTSQIIQAIVDAKISKRGSIYQFPARNSLSTKPKLASVVRMPNYIDDDSVPLPDSEVPELTTMEEIPVMACEGGDGANQDMERSTLQADDSSIKDELLKPVKKVTKVTFQVDDSDVKDAVPELRKQATKITLRSEDSSAKDALPEYMRGRRSLYHKMVTRRGSFEMFNSIQDTLQSRVHAMVSSKVAEVVVTLAIVLNAFNIGCEADWTMKHSSDDPPLVFQVANTSFSVFFTIELVLRIYAYRTKFFSGESSELSWNLFDTFLVVSALVDEVLSLLVSTPNFTAIRVLRVFRLVRVIRVVRVLRFFQDLRIIVAGIAGAIRSMLWALVLLFLMMYLVSICLMQLTAFELEKMDPVGREVALSYWGSLILSIYTLYQSITGGVDWGDAAQPLLEISPFLAVLFSLYISFSVLAVLNIITGVFVENAQHISVADEEQLVIEGFENRVKWFEEVKKLFSTMVGDEGALDAENFNAFLDEVKVQACFRRLGIDVHETSKNGLFKLLDFNGTGSVDLEEFALGLQNLHGAAKAIDVARIHCEIKKMIKDVQLLCGSLREDDFAADSQFFSLNRQPSSLSDARQSWLSDFG